MGPVGQKGLKLQLNICHTRGPRNMKERHSILNRSVSDSDKVVYLWRNLIPIHNLLPKPISCDNTLQLDREQDSNLQPPGKIQGSTIDLSYLRLYQRISQRIGR